MVGSLLDIVILVIANLKLPKLQDFAYVQIFHPILSYRMLGAMAVILVPGMLMVVEA
jgi:hypothetical protein